MITLMVVPMSIDQLIHFISFDYMSYEIFFLLNFE